MYPKRNKKNIQFLKDDDVDHMIKYSNQSLVIFVALHELLGHGTGKLLTRDVKTGKQNFPKDLKNPFTGEKITTEYLSTETWS